MFVVAILKKNKILPSQDSLEQAGTHVLIL